MRPHTSLLAGFLASITISMLPVSGIAAEASKFQIRSPSFAEGATIPTQFSCNGANLSPPLSWSGVPEGTKSLVLLMDDPDAPGGTFVHWVVDDIPPGSQGFKSGSPEGKPGMNGMGRAAYMGPCPPPGPPHHYHFRLFALDANLNLTGSPNADEVRNAMKDRVKESSELIGIFGR
jgi:Raf kinase inhibitor-like YbhB/YbcL family protein